MGILCAKIKRKLKRIFKKETNDDKSLLLYDTISIDLTKRCDIFLFIARSNKELIQYSIMSEKIVNDFSNHITSNVQS